VPPPTHIFLCLSDPPSPPPVPAPSQNETAGPQFSVDGLLAPALTSPSLSSAPRSSCQLHFPSHPVKTALSLSPALAAAPRTGSVRCTLTARTICCTCKWAPDLSSLLAPCALYTRGERRAVSVPNPLPPPPPHPSLCCVTKDAATTGESSTCTTWHLVNRLSLHRARNAARTCKRLVSTLASSVAWFKCCLVQVLLACWLQPHVLLAPPRYNQAPVLDPLRLSGT